MSAPQYRRGVTEAVGENPLSFCAPEIQNGQAWDWTPASKVEDRKPIAILATFYLFKYCYSTY